MSLQLQTFLDLIKSEISKYAVLKSLSDKFEEQTKVNFEYLVVGLIIAVLLMLFSGFGANLICHITAFAYPFYSTLVVLNSPEKGPSSQFWLVYWGKSLLYIFFITICIYKCLISFFFSLFVYM